MNLKRALPVLLLLVLPVAVAVFDISVLTALIVVLAWVLWQWLASLKALTRITGEADFVIETIGISHFAETVRWSLDRLGVDYRERVCAGTLGAFYAGRTVPVLEFRAGRSRSRIGNSTEILRYLRGTAEALAPARADFLAPNAERTDFEQTLARYGRNLQVWAYTHLLEERDIMLRAWGADDPRVPAWQRKAIQLLYPLQVILMRRAFRLTPEHYTKATERIEKLLGDIDARLESSPNSILGGESINYTDIAFAALSTPWLLPPNFAGRDEGILEPATLPAAMQNDIERFRSRFARAAAFADRLYREERGATHGVSS